jgi:tetratricopeptide (TPR) repeat protein
MELLLDNVFRRLLAAFAAAVATAGLALPLWKYFQVDRLETEGSLASLERAILIQPDKADLYGSLGHSLQFEAADNSGRAIAALERATELDPHSGDLWIELALAREQQGDLAGAEQAIHRARVAEPRTPGILWHEMNFALRREQNERGLGLARELLAEDPEYTARTLTLFSSVAPPAVLIRDVLPADLSSMTDAILIFSRMDNLSEAAEPLWTRILALNQAPSSYYLRTLLDGVVDSGDIPLAGRIWSDAIRRGWIAGEAASLNEPLYNGDFHQPLLNFGFDWRVIPNPEASVWIEARGPQPGQQSLCVEFSQDARASFAHVTHVVPVEPETYYSLHGFMRTNRISSRGGAYLQAFEIQPRRGQIATTLPVIGTGGWQEVSLRLETSPDTRLVQLALVRPGVGPGEAAASGQVCIAAIEWKSLGQVKPAITAGAAR